MGVKILRHIPGIQRLRGGRVAYSTSLLDVWGEGWQHLIRELEEMLDRHVRTEAC